MFADLRPMMNHTVLHWQTPTLDVFGQIAEPSTDAYGNVLGGHVQTRHRCAYHRFDTVLESSRDNGDRTDAKAMIWLLDHPNPIKIGDYFTMPGGGVLKVIAIDESYQGNTCLHRISLS